MQKKQANLSQALKEAVQLHQEGKLDQAALRYRAILNAQPNHFDAMHLLGVVRFQQGLYAEAVDPFEWPSIESQGCISLI